MDTPANTSVLFQEKQQFRQPWIWALLLLISAAVLAVAFTHHSFWFALVVLLLDTAIAGFIYSLKLTTEVNQDGVCVRFFPLWVRQTIPFSDFARYEARTYRPILEYGGWAMTIGCRGKTGTMEVPKVMFWKHCAAAAKMVRPSRPAPPVVSHTA